jgi:hypothetical protein
MSTKRLPPEFGESKEPTKNDGAQRELTRRDFVRIASTVGAVGAAIAGSELLAGTAFAAPPAKKTKMDTLTVTCDSSSPASITLKVCAYGTTGAPAGFSIQWMKKTDFDAAGGLWPVDSSCISTVDAITNTTTTTGACPPVFCKASFSGNANGSSYNLGAATCVTVKIGDNLFDDPGASSTCPSTPLECNTEYVFRAFAHANSSLQRSDFTATLTCATLFCDSNGGCTYTQGYWKTHGPVGCLTGNNTNVWPVTPLTLGAVSYTDLELCSIFNTPAAGNGLISLAHQLIAAKLNVANGADATDVADAIAAADALIGDLVVPPVGTGSLANSATSTLTGTLTSFNEGTIGPGHCA